MRRAPGEKIARSRAARLWGKASVWGNASIRGNTSWCRTVVRRAVVCAAALCFLASCASGDTVAASGLDGPISDSFDLSTPIATTAAVADAPPDDPTPIALPTAITVPRPTPASSERDPTAATPSETVTTSQTPTPVAPAVAATAGPAISGSAPTAAPTVVVPIAGSQTVLAANGGEVYTLNCARCHAENGLGANASQYSSPLIGVGNRYSSAGMIAELTNGHPVTFGFAQRLSTDEIASVVAYVKATFP